MNYLQLLATLGIGGAHPGGLLLTKKIFDQEQFPLSYTILDAGCGTGQTTAYLHQLGYNVTGLDINNKMIEHAKKRNLARNMKISYYIEDLASTSFSDSSFDIVLSESVLQFTTLPHTLPEIYRILKNNGILIAIEMVQNSPLTDEEQHELTSFYGMKDIPTIEQWKELFSHFHLPVKNILTSNTIELIDYGDPTTEFSPSSDIPQETFELLTHHEELTEKYANKVSYCVFYAVKGE